MARSRERYERSDVPKSSAFRSIMALLIVGCIGVAAYLLVTRLWTRVQLENHLSDREIASALRHQSKPEELEGFHPTGLELECTAVIYVSDLERVRHLERVEVLAVNPNGRATVINIRPDSVVPGSSDESRTLADVAAEDGPYEVISALSRVTNMMCSHALVVSDEPWSRIVRHRPLATDALEILRTDMDDDGLLAMSSALNALGIANLSHVEAPSHSEENVDEEGASAPTGRSLVYRADLGVILGTYAQD